MSNMGLIGFSSVNRSRFFLFPMFVEKKKKGIYLLLRRQDLDPNSVLQPEFSLLSCTLFIAL